MYSDKLFGISKRTLDDPQGARKDRVRQVQASKEREVEAERVRMADMRAIMSLPEGRRFMWSILEMTNVFGLSYTGNADTHFNEGRRSVGLVFLADMHEHMINLYNKMVNEVNVKQELNDD